MTDLGRTKSEGGKDLYYAEVGCVVPMHDPDLAHLDRTLASVRATLPAGRIVVVSDGCTPSAERNEIIERHDADRVSYPDRRGPGHAIALGWRTLIEAGTRTLCVLDVGDVWYPLDKRGQIERARYTQACFSTAYDEHAQDTRAIDPSWTRRIYTDNQFQESTWVLSASTVAHVKPDVGLLHGWEWEWAMRVQHEIGWTHYPKVTGTATEWPGGYSDTTDPRRRADIAKVVKRGRDLWTTIRTGRPLNTKGAWWR